MSIVQPFGTAAAPRIRGAAAVLTRRRLEMVLGMIWVLDGALQFQPYMFTNAFFTNMLGMANMGLPGPVSSAIFQVTTLLTKHPVIWNAAFAALQVAIGAGLLWPRMARLARPVSVVWALGVWVVGEGVGALFMPGTSALNGAPGAALLYAVAAVMLWPRRQDDDHIVPVERDGPADLNDSYDHAERERAFRPPRVAAADAGILGGRGALCCWALLWAGLSLLELGAANHAAVVPAAQVSNIANGEPGWLAAINHHAGHLLAGRGAVFALTAALVQLAVGLGALVPRSRRLALGAGIGLAVCYGILGQDLGGILTGQATDPGSAPLLVLLALVLWPRQDLTGSRRHVPGTRQYAPDTRLNIPGTRRGIAGPANLSSTG